MSRDVLFLAQNGTLLIGTSTCEIVTVDITAPDTAPTVRAARVFPPSFVASRRAGPPSLAQRRCDWPVRQSPGELRCDGAPPWGGNAGAAQLFDFACQVGEDRTLRFWDLEQRRMEAAFNLGMRCRSVHVSSDGRLYAVGHAAGQFSLWDVASMRCAAKNAFRKEEIDDIRFRLTCASALPFAFVPNVCVTLCNQPRRKAACGCHA
jgi:hypothetical protein